MDENKVCFIICVNNQLFFEECARYIQRLVIPEGMSVELLEISGAKSMASGYNEGMNSSNAKYKIYMHQDAFILNKYLIRDIVFMFKRDISIGMVGLEGVRNMPGEGIMWLGERVPGHYEVEKDWEEYYDDIEKAEWEEVEAIDGVLMATQYDIPWREDVFDGWDFYDASQSFEMRKAGYRVVVPLHKFFWHQHDDKPVLAFWDYDKYRKKFLEEYCSDKGRSMITVLMIVHNEIENVKLSVESFRLFADTELAFVLVDNHSTDGLREWAEKQRDLTYVLLDVGDIGCGKVINMVRKKLEINTDILIMEGPYLLLPKCLSRLKELLYSEKDIGAVCGVVCNDCPETPMICTNYNEAIGMVDTEEGAKGEYVLLSPNSAVLWKKDYIDILGGFEEEMDSTYAVLDDYCIRTIMSDGKIMACSNAFLWGIGDISVQYIRSLNDVRRLEKKWGMHYFNRHGNIHLIQQIEAKEEEEFAVLEIGCDCGVTLLKIKNRYPKVKIYGCEINKMAAAVASHVAEISVNNIEDKNLPFPKKMFRHIILGDVLEHLHNPLEVLVYCREFLCEGGSVIASIPNLMHISVMEQLLKGNFTYTETGLLDKSHIHFFTYYEIVRMFTEAGYHISAMNSINVEISEKQQRLMNELLALEGNAVEKWMYEAFQYNVKANI